MIDVQYSENVSILQLSDTAFVLKINDAKVYHFLLTHCERELGWGKMIQTSQSFLNGEIEYQINLTEMDVEHFGREFFMLEPELLDDISKN